MSEIRDLRPADRVYVGSFKSCLVKSTARLCTKFLGQLCVVEIQASDLIDPCIDFFTGASSPYVSRTR